MSYHNSPIAPFDRLKAALSVVLNKVKEEAEDYGRNWVNQGQEFTVHQAFINSDLDSTNNNDNEVESQPNNLSLF